MLLESMRAKTFYLAFLVCPSLVLAQNEAPKQRVNLAGTFNNWATQSSEWEMKPTGNGNYELRHFFRCGTYKFKFVFDGSWDRHLGDAGNGKLEQPGRDIEFSFPQSGEYLIGLDTNAKTFGIVIRRDALRPHAIILVQRISGDQYQLDGSKSIGRPDHDFIHYVWNIKDSEGYPLPSTTGAKFLIKVDKPGTYSAKLSVVDGSKSRKKDNAVDEFTTQINLAKEPADGVEFVCEPEGFVNEFLIESVDLIGDFNGWKRGANPMFAAPGQKKYSCKMALPDGVHHYKFLINGCIYKNDPKADRKLNEPDKLGGFNNGIRVGLDATSFGAAKNAFVECGAIKHDPSDRTYVRPINRNLAQISIRTLRNDADNVRLSKLIEKPVDINLFLTSSSNGFDYWSTNVTAPLTYDFFVYDGQSYAFVSEKGCHFLKSREDAEFVSDLSAGITAKLTMEFETPDWAKRAVWYQIFPERFRNGDPANDPPKTVPWTQSWYKPFVGKDKSKPQERGEFNSFIYDRRYGGDLQGVKEKLPYLRELGITAIYFNPIFLAESLHKYDASDYRHVDDFFGVKDSLKEVSGETVDPKTWQWSKSDKVFLDFLKEAHAQGFKVIIDGVFNHVGRNFWAFQDVMKNGEKSAFVDWFDIKSFKPFHYKAWDKDDGSLPRLKHDDALGLSKPVREHLFAVTKRWMDPNGDGDPSDGIDGWRLDVAGDINVNFWKDWRKLVKSINPDAYIVAELWEESSEWLDGRSFDAVMNYPFARASQRFFVNDKKASKPSGLDKELKDALAWYEPQVNYVLMNLFDSHDTDRVASMFMNPDLEYDKANRLQDNGPNYNPAKPTRLCYDKMKLMVTFQMMYLGAPMVYYGDEVGMYGADDPSDRKPMLWADLPPNDDPDERIVPDVLEHYRRMIAIRNTFPALQLGAMHTILMDDPNGVYVFGRSLDDECIVVAINNSAQAHKIEFKSPWSDGTEVVRLDDPESVKVLAPDKSDGRPTIQIVSKPITFKIADKKLSGISLAPYSAAILRPIVK